MTQKHQCWADASGTCIGGSLYEVFGLSAVSGGLGSHTAINLKETGHFQSDLGTLTLVREGCVARSYRDGQLAEQGACPFDLTPLALRVEPDGKGRFLASAVAPAKRLTEIASG